MYLHGLSHLPVDRPPLILSWRCPPKSFSLLLGYIDWIPEQALLDFLCMCHLIVYPRSLVLSPLESWENWKSGTLISSLKFTQLVASELEMDLIHCTMGNSSFPPVHLLPQGSQISQTSTIIFLWNLFHPTERSLPSSLCVFVRILIYPIISVFDINLHHILSKIAPSHLEICERMVEERAMIYRIKKEEKVMI